MTDFDTFWSLYPRKVGKLKVRDKCWPKALREDTAEAIMAGLEAQLPSLMSKEPQYRPHPSTWLNEGRWMDGVEAVGQGKPQDRLYENWTDAEKREVSEFVVKWGERFAVNNARYLKADIEKLRAEGYLQPRSVTG